MKCADSHGIYGTGRDMDETFGLIETVEKTAQIYMLTLRHVQNVIPDQTLRALAQRFGITPVSGILD